MPRSFDIPHLGQLSSERAAAALGDVPEPTDAQIALELRCVDLVEAVFHHELRLSDTSETGFIPSLAKPNTSA